MSSDETTSELDESLGLFEAALSARSVTLEAPPKGSILAAVDASDQDDTVRQAAAAASSRLLARTIEIGAEGSADARAQVDRILARAKAEGAALIVADTPFGEDLGALRGESLGAVIDILLAESPLPLLLVREPLAEPMKTLSRPIVLLDWRPSLQNVAAAWAAALARPEGEIDLVAAPEPSALAEFRALLGEGEGTPLLDDLIRRAESRLAGSILSALRRSGDDGGFDVRLEVAAGPSPVDLALDRASATRLVVLAYRGDEGSGSLARARSLILRSRGPVLAVGALH